MKRTNTPRLIMILALLWLAVIAAACRSAPTDEGSSQTSTTGDVAAAVEEIALTELDVWGEVTAIGLRTTRIRTVNNREVVVPNSLIGANQIVNYTRPVPEIRIQTELSVAYGTDIEQIRQIIAETVRGVAGVLTDKPISVYFREFNDAARKIRVYWYVNSIRNREPVQDQVNSAIERALQEAGIEIPFPTYNLLLKQEDQVKRSDQ